MENGIEVEGPDGQVHQFPAGTPMQALNAQMAQRYGGRSGQLAPSAPPAAPALAAGAASSLPNDIENKPKYFNSQDMLNLGLATLPQGRAIASIVNNTPGKAQAEAEAKEVGKGVGSMKIKAVAAQKMLETLQTFRQHAAEAGPGVLDKAIGPDYSGGSSFNPLPDTSGSAYQAIAAKLPNIMGGSPDAYQLNLEMQHLKRAVAAQFKQSGSKDGATDAAQNNLLEAIGEAMKAKDSKGFFSVLHDADNFVRSSANLGPKEAKSILDKIPDGPQWQEYRAKVKADLDAKSQKMAGGAANTDGPQSRSALQQAVESPVWRNEFPKEAVDLLAQNSSAAMRKKFDEAFGEKAAERAMRARNGR